MSEEMNLSIVVPALNEEGNIQPLHEEVQTALADGYDWELIFIDDGSSDSTYDEMEASAEQNGNVRAIKLKRSFGQSAALAAGFDHATGDVVVPMDADLQNDPADIPRLLEKLEEGYDCVSGWREDRKDPLTKTIPSKIQTYLSWQTGVKIHDFGCTMKAYRKEALDDVQVYGEGHRYIPAKLHKKGFTVTEIPVNHRQRKRGETKYGWKRLFKGSMDLAFHVFWNQFSTRPIHFLGGTGLLFASAGTLVGLHVLFLKYVYGEALLGNFPRLLLATGLFLFGVQVAIFGFIAEMLTKVYYDGKQPYRVEEITGERERDSSEGSREPPYRVEKVA